MFYVYVLYSESADKFYIGFTSNLEGRLEAHNYPENSFRVILLVKFIQNRYVFGG